MKGDGIISRKGESKALTQAYIVQDIAFNAIRTFNEERKTESGKLPLGEKDAQSLGTLVKAWSEAQDRVRIHRNKPLPGVLKHESRPRKRKRTEIVILEPQSSSGQAELEQAGPSAGS